MQNWGDEQFAAYLAAFTDGEGCIRLEDDRFVNIYLANCHRGVLDQIQMRLGYGNIHSQRQQPHWSERFRLKVSSAPECQDFLLRVRPFLIIKTEIADEALRRLSEMQSALEARNLRNEQIRTLCRAGWVKRDIAWAFGLSAQRMAGILAGQYKTEWRSRSKSAGGSRSGSSK